ncbi:MAG: hypothetical protein K2X11_14790 [Acetobacteraceae bacterium]|nr:hypothetical protein [Acetobacteraceae bacterium]
MSGGFRVLKIWRDHEYERGQHAGRVGEAVPRWSKDRSGFDVYAAGNKLANAETVPTLDDVWSKLAAGYGVRCVEPTTGYESILYGRFKAVIQQA